MIRQKLILVLSIVSIGIAYYYLFEKEHTVDVQIESGEIYRVKDKKNKVKAAKMMHEINNRIKKLIKHLRKKDEHKDIYKVLKNKYSRGIIKEGFSDDETSYVMNKNEITFCLRNKQNDKLHNINLVMYVVIHELAHLVSDSVGHTEEFMDKFDRLLSVAKEKGIYKKIDFSENPKNYCGIVINQ